MRMRAKLTLALLFLAALPIFIVLVINLRHVLRFEQEMTLKMENKLEERNRALRGRGQVNQRLAGKTAFNINKRFAEIERELRRLGKKKHVIGTMNIKEQEALLKKFVVNNPETTRLEVVNSKGTLINLYPLDKKRLKARDNLADTLGFRRLYEGGWGKALGEVHQAPRGSEAAYLVGITKKGKRFALRAVINLQSFLTKVKAEDGGKAFLVNREKFYIAHQDKKLIFKPFNQDDLPYLSDVMTDLAAKVAGYRVTYYQGNTCVISYSPLKVADWGVGILVPVEEGPASVKRLPFYRQFLTRQALAIPLLFLLVILFIVPFVSLWGTRPYQELGRRLKEARVGGTDLEEQAEGELGELLGDIQGLLTSTRQGMEKDLAELAGSEAAVGIGAGDVELQQELEKHRERLEEKLKELDALRVVSETLRQDKKKSEEKVVGLQGELEKLRRSGGETKGAAKLKDSAVVEIMGDMDSVLGELKEFLNNSLGAEEATPEERSRILSELVGKSAGLEKLVSEVQEYCSLETLGVRKKEDLNEIMGGVILDAGAQAEARGIDNEQNLVEEKLEAEVDKGKLAHALRLMFEAGVRASAASGNIIFSSAREEDNAVLRARFFGIQPADGLEQSIFHDYQGQESVFAGSGLMLPMARMIIEAHGGGAVVEAPTGGGVEFVITLPLADMQSKTAVGVDPQEPLTSEPMAEAAPAVSIPGMEEIARGIAGDDADAGKERPSPDQVEILDINPPVGEATGMAPAGFQTTTLLDMGEVEATPAAAAESMPGLDTLSVAPESTGEETSPLADIETPVVSDGQEGLQESVDTVLDVGNDGGDLEAAIAEATEAIVPTGETPEVGETTAGKTESVFDPAAFEQPSEVGTVETVVETPEAVATQEGDGASAFDPAAFAQSAEVDDIGFNAAAFEDPGEPPEVSEAPISSAVPEPAEPQSDASPSTKDEDGKSGGLDFSAFE